MKPKLSGCPDWDVRINEVSVGIYRLVAIHPLGPSIDLTGMDPDELLAQASKAAKDMEQQHYKNVVAGR